MGERLTFTFALTGRRNGKHGTQGVALGYELAGLSARTEPQIGLFRTISTYLIFLDFEHATLRGRCANIQRRFEAKHCSSLCSQSEGVDFLAAFAG